MSSVSFRPLFCQGFVAVVCMSALVISWGGPAIAQEKESAAVVAEPPTRDEIITMIRERRFADGLQRLDDALVASPNDYSVGVLYYNLVMAIGNDKSDDSLAMLRSILQRHQEASNPGVGNVIALAAATESILLRDESLSLEDKLALLDRLDEKTVGGNSMLEMPRRTAMNRRVMLLLSADRKEEALAKLEALVTESKADLAGKSPTAIAKFVTAVQTFQSLGGTAFPERAAELMAEAQGATSEAFAAEQVDPLVMSAFFMLRLSHANMLARTDIDRAEKLLNELGEALESAPTKVGEQNARAVDGYARSVQQLRSRVAATKKINAMIGTEAPEIDAEHFVAGEPVSLADLRGKVVLIDFWAVWCGPCIITFPHLIEWHEKYADKGLVILGATRFYGYRWDDEAGRAVRVEEEIPAEQELAMLEKFRESHGLKHPFFVTPAQSDFQAAYGVTGIPHAVLIDKAGKIQMIRVGSGEANAKDLEAKIEELLGG